MGKSKAKSKAKGKSKTGKTGKMSKTGKTGKTSKKSKSKGFGLLDLGGGEERGNAIGVDRLGLYEDEESGGGREGEGRGKGGGGKRRKGQKGWERWEDGESGGGKRVGMQLERVGGKMVAKKTMSEKLALAAERRMAREVDPEDLTFTGRGDDWGSDDDEDEGGNVGAGKGSGRGRKGGRGRRGEGMLPGELEEVPEGVEVGYYVEEGTHDAKHRIRPDIALTEGIYAGKVVSSSAVFGEEDGEEESGEESDDSVLAGMMEAYGKRMEGSSDDDDDGYDGYDDGDDDDGEESDSLEAMEAEMLQLQEATRRNVEHLVVSNRGEHAKAMSVLGQSKVFDGAMQTRIALQRPLEIANVLPEAELMEAGKDAVPELEKAAAEAAAVLRDTLGLLGQLEDKLVGQAPVFLDDGEDYGTGSVSLESLADVGESDLDTLWESIQARQQAYVPHMYASIEAWNRKTMLASGMPFKNLKLKTIDRLLVDQIKDALEDTSNIRVTTQKLRAPDEEIYSSDGRYKMDGDDDVEADVEEGAGAGAGAGKRRKNRYRISEHVYDDVDFYQKLLRDMLSASQAADKMNGTGVGSGGTDAVGVSREWLARKQALRKLNRASRRKVDTRATKGRKLRYTVQDPLVNFTAPVPPPEEVGGVALLNGLFGFDLP